MTPLERLAAYAKGDPIDRLPTVPVLTNTTARVIGVRVSDFLNNPRLTADGQISAYRRFGHDVVRVMNDLFFMAEAMGAKVRHPVDETAYLEGPALRSGDEIAALRPALPGRSRQLNCLLEAASRVLDVLGHEVRVTVGVVGPFTNASHLVGANTLARWTLKHPERVHAVCRIAFESAIAYIDELIDRGASPSVTEPMGSGSVISRKAFEEFVAPNLRAMFQHIHSRRAKVTLHICGNTSRLWQSMADTGADCLSLDDEINLATAKTAVGRTVQIMGNVSPTAVLLAGTTEDVRRAVFRSVLSGHDCERGFVLASGCSLPTETPLRNIDAMMAASLEIGYPPKLALAHRVLGSDRAKQ